MILVIPTLHALPIQQKDFVLMLIQHVPLSILAGLVIPLGLLVVDVLKLIISPMRKFEKCVCVCGSQRVALFFYIHFSCFVIFSF